MNEEIIPLWAKQIKIDSSIQFLLTGNFTHPTIMDCIVVGHSSFRLYSVKSNQLVETTKYIHNKSISSASIVENSDHSEICFISKNVLSFLGLNSQHEFEVNQKKDIDHELTYVTCAKSLILLYSSLPFLSIGNRNDLNFTRYTLQVQSVLSACIINNRIAVLQRANNFEVCFYSYDDKSQLKTVYKKVLSLEIPYKLIPSVSHSAVYVLSENKISKILIQETSYFFNPFQVSSKGGDGLIIDAVSSGVNTYFLTADGCLIRFDGENLEYLMTLNGANSICSPTFNRFIVSIDSNKIQLFDREFQVLDECEDVICRCSSYRKGNFIIASGSSVHSAFYDYGIEIEKVSEMNYFVVPRLITSSSGCFAFIVYEDKCVVINEEFKDATPSFMKHLSIDRIHCNSLSFFFLVNEENVYVFDHGYVNCIKHPSTLSCFHHSTIFLAAQDSISCYIYTNNCLEKVSDRKFTSQISSIATYNSTNVVISLFDGTIYIADDDLNVREGCTLENDVFVTSLLTTNNSIIFGASDGFVYIMDDKLLLKEKFKIGNIPVTVSGYENLICCKCGKRFSTIIDQKVKSLPPDFLAIDVLSNGKCIAIVSSPKKDKTAALFTFHFTNTTIGFHSSTLFNFNGFIDRVCAARSKDAFVCSIREPPSLFWSRGEVITVLEKNEIVRTIVEWKAKHGEKLINFWVACTEGNSSISRFMLFTQNVSDFKVRTILTKTFGEPITSFCAISPSLALFSHSDQLVGISLETGALRKIFSVKSPLKDIVFTDANTSYVAGLTNDNGFFLMKVLEKSLETVFVVKKPFLGSRIKVIGNYTVVADRFGLLEIYDITGKLGKKFKFVSPISDMFDIGNEKVLCCHICGELTLVKVSEGILLESDVSSLFSFGRSAFPKEF
ncbi:hypothetical protein TVAG_163520 [Trichomonas vaginalis G3]|uniref:DNA damage-binding protein 1 n=1 Tax=Trichomonas vaginalis (strain ATCC PRA-98 / G3) TaxID=412133 RepID=A2DG29_TRIV3|nr:quinoprotein alcohol dehydrogenase-like family [Trichomonas vaginalis G3]EAY20656.1 hypothetical protein TVAG_163520 [Trichomonas vaginalis G3]KAI5487377.1 quinoprotein alcohol dehydrogenase-like family [Trichomonas vaginalis G3]|eukprot:XP_001581642.1 hypothetical protein [Trichomonas vaginalis G3]